MILDLQMPEMEGKQCLVELRGMQPQLEVLVASGHSGEAVVEECLGMGASGFAGKPFRLTQLLRQARSILDEKRKAPSEVTFSQFEAS